MKKKKGRKAPLPRGKRKACPRVKRLPSDLHWQILQRVIDSLSDYVSPELSLGVAGAIRARDLAKYCSLSEMFGPRSMTRHNTDVHTFRANYQVVSLLRKLALPGNVDLQREAAYDSIRQAEAQCRKTNIRLRQAGKLFQDQRDIITRVLGSAIPADLAESSDCRHGPGSSYECPFKRKSTYFKYADWPYRVTSRAIPHARRLIESDARWMSYLEESYRFRYDIPSWKILRWDVFWDTILVPGDSNKITTVPKDAFKMRPIAIENSLNVMLQLGVDGYIRKRLRRFGINLNDQTENQRLAYLGSISSHVMAPATVDLASASDTVSLRICKLLLPRDWYEYLCDLRATHGYINGKLVRYSKISSMGNGYTFALESLIFYAFARSAELGYSGTSQVGVFGDDLIVSTGACPILVRNLQDAGFSINLEKSYTSGSFKESCGADWYCGLNVRPVFLRKPISTEQDIYSIYNRLNRWYNLYYPELDNPCEFLLDYIHSPLEGPYSDHEFDTYKHSISPSERYKNGKYVFRSLKSYLGVRGSPRHGFRARNLMHTLNPIVVNQWKPEIRTAGGSRFDIIDPQITRQRVTVRTTPEWCSSYSVTTRSSSTV